MTRMSRRRLENLDETRQKRLFESAAEEFAEKGFDAASLNRILERSGMSKSSLYYYFDDKADLFTTLIERSLEVLFKHIGGLDLDALAAETFWSDFEDRYRKSLLFVESHGWLVRFGSMFYSLRSNPQKGATTDRLFQATRTWVGKAITRGQTLGVIRTDLPQSMLIDSTMGLIEALDRWVIAHWNDLSEADKQAIPQKHIGLFRRLLTEDGCFLP